MIPARNLGPKNRTVRVRSDISWLPEKYSQRASRIRILFRPSKGERRVFRRRKRIKPSAWAPKYRRITYGPLRGSYHDPHFMPHMNGILDTAAHPFVREIVNCKAPQTGGSAGWETIIGWFADNNPGDALIVYPDRDTAKKRCNDYLQPMFTESPRLHALLTGKEDDRSSLRVKLQVMLIYMGWAGSVTSIGNVSVRYLIVDELDKCPLYPAKGEATLEELVAERTTAYDKFGSLKVWNSTPTAMPSRITAKLDTCDVIFDFYAPCPDCGHMQVLEFERIDFAGVRSPEEMRRNRLARYVCAACGSLWDDRMRDMALRQGLWYARDSAEKKRLQQAGEWQGQPVGLEREKYLRQHRPERVGFHSPAWISPLNSLSKCATAFLAGLEDDAAMLYFDTQIRAVEHIPHRRARKEDAILELRDERPEGLVPSGGVVAGLMAGVDTQDDGCYFAIYAFGWGLQQDMWLVRHGFLPNDAALDQVLFGDQYTDADGIIYPVLRCVRDAMGHRTDDVYNYCLRWPRRVYPYKGTGRRRVGRHYSESIVEYYPGSGRKLLAALSLYTCDSHHYKDALASKLAVQAGDPGSVRLHAGVDADFINQMCAEVVDEHGLWVNPSRRPNHYWDCSVMALVAADTYRLKFWAPKAPSPEQPEQAPAQPVHAHRPAAEQPQDRRQNPYTGGRALFGR